jgi:hypothetical protein
MVVVAIFLEVIADTERLALAAFVLYLLLRHDVSPWRVRHHALEGRSLAGPALISFMHSALAFTPISAGVVVADP